MLDSCFCVGTPIQAAREETFYGLELFSSVAACIPALQPIERLRQHRERPLPLEQKLGCEIIRDLLQIVGFRSREFQRNNYALPAAALGLGAFAPDRKKMLNAL